MGTTSTSQRHGFDNVSLDYDGHLLLSASTRSSTL